MSLKNELFAELEGFAIYEPSLMSKYIVDNNIGNDLLSYLTTSEHGDIVTQNGAIVPIIGIPADYYKFVIVEKLPDNYLVEAKGWVLKIKCGKFNVVGIGYLADVMQITEDNSLSFLIPNGWYELSIISYMDSFDKNQKCFGLNLKQTSNKPDYNGDMETDYLFEQQ